MARINDTNRDFTVEKDLITKIQYPHLILAGVIGVSSGDFHNKWYEKRGSRFTDVQKDKIRHHILCMGRIILENLK